MSYKIVKRGMIPAILVLLIAVATILPGPRGLISAAIQTQEVFYFNDLVQTSTPASETVTIGNVQKDIHRDGTNEFCFGDNRYLEAEDAISAKKVKTVEEFIITSDGNGDLLWSVKTDPALCAAIALHMDESLSLPEKILRDEQSELIGQRADKAHKHYLKDGDYWARSIELIAKYLKAANVKVEKISTAYTSMMYMWHNHLDDNKPSVIVRNTPLDKGGHKIVFKTQYGTIELRLECGYQPLNVKYWTPPKETPEQPETTTQPPSTTQPETTTQPPSTTQPTTEETTKAPKNPDGGPNKQGEGQPGHEDYGGPTNVDNYTELTPEPTSPSKYVAPDPPTTETQTTKKSESSSTTVPSTTKSSGSDTVDRDNGKTETRVATDPDNGRTTTKTYEVVAGDGTTRKPLEEVQEQDHSPQTVEEPVCGDNNVGDLGEDEVE